MIIVIDGPSGAGKSTIAKRLSKKLRYVYLDTGALYRCIALAAYKQQILPQDTQDLYRLAKSCRINFKNGKVQQQVFLNGKKVTRKIRTPTMSLLASEYSALPVVRKALLYQQRKFGKEKIVAEGRDLGTIVFPKAKVKFFVTASVEERAKRRFKELKEHHPHITLVQIKKEITSRDKADSKRAHAPLRKAKDAILIDTTTCSVDQVVACMYRMIQKVS